MRMSFDQPQVKAPVIEKGGSAVSTWLWDTRHVSKYDEPPPIPHNTPNDIRTGYIPPTDNFRGPLRSADVTTRPSQNMLRDLKLDTQQKQALDTASVQGKSDAALFSRALRDTRLPQPKILTFDGDPKKYKMFIASFQSNVEEMLDEDDYKIKLTLLLQHCTGKALELIEDCVMLAPPRG